MLWLFIIFYLAAQLLIGYAVSRRIRSEEDYFLGGRALSLPLVSFSLFATWFGAETCIGSSAAVYDQGLAGSRADPFGYSVCLLLLGAILATRLWRGKYVTLADLYRERYGPAVEQLAVWIILPSSLIWAAAQVRAFGQILAATTTISVDWAILVAAVFVVAYTSLGGFLGDVITDFVQGIIIFAGIILIFAFTLADIPDPGALLAKIDAARLSFLKADETLLQRMDRWMIPILGSLVSQEVIARVLAARSAPVARNAGFVACAMYLVMGSIPVLLGLIGPHILPDLADTEQFLIALSQKVLHPAAFVIFLGALISAILATIDSILLAVSALVSHNVLARRLGAADEAAKVRLARVVVILAGAAAYVLAVYGRGIYDLVEAASSFGTAGILVITLCALYSRQGHAAAAVLALLAGLVLTPLGNYVFAWQAPFVYSVLGAAAGFLTGHLWSVYRLRLSNRAAA